MTVTGTEIHDNGMYRVVLSEPAENTSWPSHTYKVINNMYDVLEMETTVLIRALFAADDYKAHVEAHSEMLRAEQGVEQCS